MSETFSTCPVVRTELMKLFERVTFGGDVRLLEFEKEILWLRESNTMVELWWDDTIISAHGTLNDWYGFLSSATTAVDEITANLVHKLKLEQSDRLAVVSTVLIMDTPVLRATSQEAIAWNLRAQRKKYLSIYGQPWFTSDKTENADGVFVGLPSLKPIAVPNGKFIYSTRNPDRAALNAWIAEHKKAAGVA